MNMMVSSAAATREGVAVAMAAKGRKFFEELGARLAELRKAQGLTQTQLAELLGISQQLVAAHESGERRIPVDLLAEPARLLGVSVEQILGLKPENGKRGPTPRLQQQLERISRLPKARQRFVMEMLETALRQA